MIAEDRFWSYVRESPAGCWIWQGGRDRYGYGLFSLAGRKVLAHRFAYELVVGLIPRRMTLDHVVCDTPACVNPAHLTVASRRDNILRSDPGRHGRAKTHCPQGHAYTPENTVLHSTNGGRMCRECRAESRRRSKRRRAK